MNAITHRAFFGDAEQAFTFDPPMIRELEAVTGSGIGVVFARLVDRRFHFDDIGHVIRLGLIGASMEPEKASRLVKTYVEGRPMLENYGLAVEILSALWFGKPGAPAPAPQFEHQAEPVETPAPDMPLPIGSGVHA